MKNSALTTEKLAFYKMNEKAGLENEKKMCIVELSCDFNAADTNWYVISCLTQNIVQKQCSREFSVIYENRRLWKSELLRTLHVLKW